jgi:hypothetical protein
MDPRRDLAFRNPQPPGQLTGRDPGTPQDPVYHRTACHDLIVIACAACTSNDTTHGLPMHPPSAPEQGTTFPPRNVHCFM